MTWFLELSRPYFIRKGNIDIMISKVTEYFRDFKIFRFSAYAITQWFYSS